MEIETKDEVILVQDGKTSSSTVIGLSDDDHHQQEEEKKNEVMCLDNGEGNAVDRIMSLEDEEKKEEEENHEQDDHLITLVSLDGERFALEKKYVKMSKMLKTTIVSDTEANEIPVPNVKGNILKKIIEYLKFHHNNLPEVIPKPLTNNKLEESVSKWDFDFIQIDRDALMELVLAANYLDINTLLQLCSAKIANDLVICGTTEKMRQYFGVKNDWTPEDLAKAEEETRWAETTTN